MLYELFSTMLRKMQNSNVLAMVLECLIFGVNALLYKFRAIIMCIRLELYTCIIMINDTILLRYYPPKCYGFGWSDFFLYILGFSFNLKCWKLCLEVRASNIILTVYC